MIPAPLRRRFRIEEGSLVVAEATEDGILIRPAIAVPVEVYTPQRKAEFLLSNAMDADDYAWAVEEVRRGWDWIPRECRTESLRRAGCPPSPSGPGQIRVFLLESHEFFSEPAY